jgi:hypothetical protein
VLAFSAVAYLAATPEQQVLRRFAWLYAVAAVACFVVPNPIGGNITRLGKLIALPLACYLLSPGRRRQLARFATATVAALLWPLVPLTTAVAHGAGDPSQHQAYYQGLLSFLKTQNPADGRLEIPFTREHWEAAQVAPAFPIARGWERQTDLQHNAVLYGPLTAGTYKAWLDDNAVALVALPAVPLDDGGRAEAALLANPPPYLVPVWSDAHWRVWRVVGGQALATGAATVTDLGPASVRANFTRPGTVVIRIRSSRLWQVTSGRACVGSTSGGWLAIRSAEPGPVTVRARMSLQLVTGQPGCDIR